MVLASKEMCLIWTGLVGRAQKSADINNPLAPERQTVLSCPLLIINQMSQCMKTDQELSVTLTSP